MQAMSMLEQAITGLKILLKKEGIILALKLLVTVLTLQVRRFSYLSLRGFFSYVITNNFNIVFKELNIITKYAVYMYNVHICVYNFNSLFSLPEPKARVRYSDQNFSISVIVVVVVVNFSLFHLLLQNHLVNSNQSWHKASLRKVLISLLK